MARLHRDKQQDLIMRRAEKVRSLRLAGFTYRQIADRMDIGVGTVKADLDRINVEFPQQTTRELVAEQNDKLVAMMAPQFLKAAAGDHRATTTMLKLMDHQAKLWGLYNLDNNDGVNDAKHAMQTIVNALLTAPHAEARKDDTGA